MRFFSFFVFLAIRSMIAASFELSCSINPSVYAAKLKPPGRRTFLVFTSALLTTIVSSKPSAAVMMESTQTTFVAGQPISSADARKRFMEARKILRECLDNYDDISKGGGDNIRRYLGTVGTTSAMYGISKVLKVLQEEAEDIIEYTEAMSEFDYSLRAADTAAYSSNFVEFSSAKTKPAKFIADARYEAQQMLKYFDTMALELDLK